MKSKYFCPTCKHELVYHPIINELEMSFKTMCPYCGAWFEEPLEQRHCLECGSLLPIGSKEYLCNSRAIAAEKEEKLFIETENIILSVITRVKIRYKDIVNKSISRKEKTKHGLLDQKIYPNLIYTQAIQTIINTNKQAILGCFPDAKFNTEYCVIANNSYKYF